MTGGLIPYSGFGSLLEWEPTLPILDMQFWAGFAPFWMKSDFYVIPVDKLFSFSPMILLNLLDLLSYNLHDTVMLNNS